MSLASDIMAVIPAYNPGDTIVRVVHDVSRYIQNDQILVVDDGSTDGLAQRLKQTGVCVISHPHNRGKGAALRTAFEYTKNQTSACAAVALDADGQHDPHEIPRFLQAFRERHADLIIGYRAFDPRIMPLPRIASNRITSALLSFKLGQNIKDSQCGFRLYSRRLMDVVELDTAGYETESEILIKACQGGMRLEFVPVSTVYAGEKSHIRGLRDIRRFVKLYFRN